MSAEGTVLAAFSRRPSAGTAQVPTSRGSSHVRLGHGGVLVGSKFHGPLGLCCNVDFLSSSNMLNEPKEPDVKGLSEGGSVHVKFWNGHTRLGRSSSGQRQLGGEAGAGNRPENFLKWRDCPGLGPPHLFPPQLLFKSNG